VVNAPKELLEVSILGRSDLIAEILKLVSFRNGKLMSVDVEDHGNELEAMRRSRFDVVGLVMQGVYQAPNLRENEEVLGAFLFVESVGVELVLEDLDGVFNGEDNNGRVANPRLDAVLDTSDGLDKVIVQLLHLARLEALHVRDEELIEEIVGLGDKVRLVGLFVSVEKLLINQMMRSLGE